MSGLLPGHEKASHGMFSGQHSAPQPYAANTRHQNALHAPTAASSPPYPASLSSERFSSSTSWRTDHHRASARSQHPLPPYGLRHKPPSAPVVLSDRSWPSLLITTWFILLKTSRTPASGCPPCCPVYRHNRRWHSRASAGRDFPRQSGWFASFVKTNSPR